MQTQSHKRQTILHIKKKKRTHTNCGHKKS